MAVPKKKRSKSLAKRKRALLTQNKLNKFINTFNTYTNLNIKKKKWISKKNTNLYFSSWVHEQWFVRSIWRAKKNFTFKSKLK